MTDNYCDKDGKKERGPEENRAAAIDSQASSGPSLAESWDKWLAGFFALAVGVFVYVAMSSPHPVDHFFSDLEKRLGHTLAFGYDQSDVQVDLLLQEIQLKDFSLLPGSELQEFGDTPFFSANHLVASAQWDDGYETLPTELSFAMSDVVIQDEAIAMLLHSNTGIDFKDRSFDIDFNGVRGESLDVSLSLDLRELASVDVYAAIDNAEFLWDYFAEQGSFSQGERKNVIRDAINQMRFSKWVVRYDDKGLIQRYYEDFSNLYDVEQRDVREMAKNNVLNIGLSAEHTESLIDFFDAPDALSVGFSSENVDSEASFTNNLLDRLIDLEAVYGIAIRSNNQAHSPKTVEP